MGENNFFYSGINGCCDGFDFVAGPIVPDPITTTTTTSITSSTSTTTTTASPYDCELAGTIEFTYCALDGNGVITVGPAPPPCVRPENLTQNDFATGYYLTSLGITVVSTATQTDACNAMTYLNTIPPNTVVNTIVGSYSSLSLGSTIYAGPNFETDCSVIPDGWYFTDESSASGIVYEVVDGIIVSMELCFPITTTTTTTVIPCISYTAVKTTVGVVAVTYTDCTGAPLSVNVGNVSGGPSSVTFCARCCPSTPAEVTLTNNGIC